MAVRAARAAWAVRARRRAWLWILILAALMLLALGGYGWYRLTQPVFASMWNRQMTVQADALERHVRVLSVDFTERSHDNPVPLEGAARYIQAQFEAQGHQVTSQPYVAGGRKHRNLIVALGPDTPEVLVVGAHYDVAGAQPGADDNASGVAGLIELGRVLRDRPLKQRVELVAYSTEEPPFFRTPEMGSAVHARSLKAAGKRVTLMLALECIGYFSDAPHSQDYPFPLLGLIYPTTGNFIGLIGFWEDSEAIRRVKIHMRSGSGLMAHSISSPRFVLGVDFSDHLNYADEGFPAMMVTDTAFYRNKAYHTPQDTPDRLDYFRMAQVVDGVHVAVDQEAGVR